MKFDVVNYNGLLYRAFLALVSEFDLEPIAEPAPMDEKTCTYQCAADYDVEDEKAFAEKIEYSLSEGHPYVELVSMAVFSNGNGGQIVQITLCHKNIF